MAALPCKMMAQIAFKAGGDVFHYLVTNNPNHLAKVSPGKVQACDLHQGSHGTIGSIIEWKYTLDGEEHTMKEVIQDIDEEKKKISYKMLEGDLLKIYKSMLITAHVETKSDVDFITYTIDYELLNPNNPHPMSVLNYFIELTKEIETHILG